MYIDIRDKKEREKFIKRLLEVGCAVKKEENKEEIMNSIYPISINEDTMEISCIHNTTCAAAAIGDKSKFVSAEEAIDSINNRKNDYTKVENYENN